MIEPGMQVVVPGGRGRLTRFAGTVVAIKGKRAAVKVWCSDDFWIFPRVDRIRLSRLVAERTGVQRDPAG